MAQAGPTLYDVAFEHDSCGFGLVAQIDGRASAWVVDTAFSALAKLSHRGGVNADGVSGDGCGVLFHRPQAWLKALADEAGIALGERFAAGVVFLDPHGDDAAVPVAKGALLLDAALGQRTDPQRVGHAGGDLFRWKQDVDRLAPRLLFRPAQDADGAGVPACHPAVRRQGEDGVADGAVQDRAQPPFAVGMGGAAVLQPLAWP